MSQPAQTIVPSDPVVRARRSLNTRRRTRRYRLQRPGRLLGVIAGMLAMAGGVYWALAGQPPWPGLERTASATTAGPIPTWILVMDGEAARGATGPANPFVLLQVDQALNTVRTLALPQETRAEIPGHGTDRLNAAYGYGGPELLMLTTSRLTGLKIDRYVRARADGGGRLVDQLVRRGGLSQSNMTVAEQKALAQVLSRAQNQMPATSVPGNVVEIAGAQYFRLDEAGTQQMLRSWAVTRSDADEQLASEEK